MKVTRCPNSHVVTLYTRELLSAVGYSAGWRDGGAVLTPRQRRALVTGATIYMSVVHPGDPITATPDTAVSGTSRGPPALDTLFTFVFKTFNGFWKRVSLMAFWNRPWSVPELHRGKQVHMMIKVFN